MKIGPGSFTHCFSPLWLESRVVCECPYNARGEHTLPHKQENKTIDMDMRDHKVRDRGHDSLRSIPVC